MENKRETNEKRPLQMCFNFQSKKTKTNATNLLSLNDDCLLSVFRYMGIRDIVNAEQTCTRLRNVANLYYRTTKTLAWTSDLPFSCASKIICKFGCFTTSLHSLRFNRVRSNDDGDTTNGYQHFIETLVDNCKNVRALTFTECDVGCEWAPFVDAIQCLESLSLVYTNFRKTSYIRRVSTLKRLHLVGFNSFTPATFNYFLSKNRRLTELVLDDCKYLSESLSYGYIAALNLESLSVEVYPENVEEVEADDDDDYEDDVDDANEVRKRFQHLKKLKITQAKPNLKLNKFLKKMSENAALDELELFKVNVDADTFAILGTMKLKTLILYPRIKDSTSSFCHKLVDAMANLKHLTLVLFDPDRDTDLSDGDLLLLIDRLRHLESLNLHHCECECDCDYIICPFRCKLRNFIDNMNKIFDSEQRPSLKLMLPRHMSRSFFHGKTKLQKKYRRILTDRVQFVRSNELDWPDTSTGHSQSFFIDFLDSLSTANVEMNSGSEISRASYSDVNPESDDDAETEIDDSSMEYGDDTESDSESDDVIKCARTRE